MIRAHCADGGDGTRNVLQKDVGGTVVWNVRGGGANSQSHADSCIPGPHQYVRGGGAECHDDGGGSGDGGRREGVFSLKPSKTKPNEVGGGLKAIILLLR